MAPTDDQSAGRSVRVPLVACLGVSALALSIAAFDLPMATFPSAFLLTIFPFLAIASIGCAVVSLLLLLRVRRHGAKFALPFIVCVATLAALELVPFTTIWLQVDFRWHRAARERVVADVEAGKLVPNVAYNARLIALGRDAADVSAGSEIVIDRTGNGTYVLFLTSRSFRHRFSGFLHAPRRGAPEKFFEFDDQPPRQLVRYGEDWYFVAN